MAVERTASAEWQGDLLGGSGTVSTQSGAVRDATIKWSSRAEAADENTSPEELIAAAHAACVDQVGDGFRMTKMHLRIRGTVDGLDEDGFRKAAEDAKDNCPVSQALSDDVEVTVEAALA